MELIFIDHKELDKYNNNNFHHEAPFTFKGNVLWIDYAYYQKISGSWLEDKLRDRFVVNIGDKHDILRYGKDSEGDENFMYVYNMMLFWYDAFFWADAVDGFKAISLDKSDMVEIRKICYTYEKFKVMLLQNLSSSLTDKINLLFNSESVEYFVKTGIASVKHNFQPYPITNITGALTQLIESKKIRNMWLDKHPLIPIYSILVTKWKDNIERCNEFRAFIDDGEVIGVSQQCIYEVYPIIKWLVIDCADFYQKVQTLWNSIYDKLDIKFKYKDAVLDLYVNGETGEPHLIEINAIGGWGPAGSALYDWENDPPDRNNKEVRLTC